MKIKQIVNNILAKVMTNNIINSQEFRTKYINGKKIVYPLNTDKNNKDKCANCRYKINIETIKSLFPQNLHEKRLTERENDYLILASRGFTNKQIAEKLHVKPESVTKMFGDIFGKTNSANKISCILYALSNDLIDTDKCKEIIEKFDLQEKGPFKNYKD